MKRVILTVISILVIIPVGLYGKQYSGPAHFWVNNSLGGVFYEIFWMLSIYLFFPKFSLLRNALIVFIATCAIECLQLWHPPFLEEIRGTFFGAALLGSTFVLSDIFYYVIGAVCGYYYLAWLKKCTQLKTNVSSGLNNS